MLCCCGSDVKVYATKNGELVHILKGHEDLVTDIVVNPLNQYQVRRIADASFSFIYQTPLSTSDKKHIGFSPSGYQLFFGWNTKEVEF